MKKAKINKTNPVAKEAIARANQDAAIALMRAHGLDMR